MIERVYNVLILCTGNSARSIMAEAILAKEGQGRFRAYSAGSRPKAHPNPLALALLEGLGYDISGFRSKSWEEFAGADAPKMDFILTVCDSAGGRDLPLLAWTSASGPLGHSGPRRRGRNRGRNAGGIPGRLSPPCETHDDLRQS